MLKLICGPSGSGKTEAIIKQIQADVSAGIRCFLLVPEQQAYISERDLTAVLPPFAGRYFEIVNFSGLAEDVFRQYGGIRQNQAESGAQALLMWETLRQLAPLLQQYGKSARSDATLTAKMLTAVEELRNNGITGEDLEQAAEQLSPDSPLCKKLRDLALVDVTYREQAGVGFGSGIAERLLRMAGLLKTENYFTNSRIYIDSFTSFTVPEYTVLRELMRQADAVTVSLCTDSPASHMPHFQSICKTAHRLMKLSDEVSAEFEITTLAPKSNSKTQALQILEHELWNFELTKQQRKIPDDAKECIHRITASNLYEESEACAIQILGLVQNGLHYREIAVVVRDTETYRGVLDAALERHGIPYFLSERTDLTAKPLSRLILSALRAVSRNYRAQDILTLLKTGLSGADLRDVALFEEYCETWHINGNRFTDPVWSMNPDGLTDRRSERAEEILSAANRVRRIVMEPLQVLAAAMRACDRMQDRCRAVYEYLTALHISEQLSAHAKQELALGQRREAGETVRLYRFVTDALTELCRLLPNTQLSTDEFLSALTLFFSTTDLGSVPNLHDCVVIGSAATLRVENLRASLLLGLCEGEFPRADVDDGILNEYDKEILEEFGLNFESRRDLRSSEELFYVYRAMTKPTEQLFLSYPTMQIDGSARTPSLAFTRIGFLFENEAKSFALSAKSGQNSAADTAEDNRQAKPLSRMEALRLSQSSIQTFVLCPYRYYATYQLGLRDKKDSSVSAADEGSFLHFVFEELLRSSLTEDGTLALPSIQELPAIADQIIVSYLERVCPIPPQEMDNRLLHLFERLRGLAILMLQDIVGEIANGLFIPQRFEQVLGGNGEQALPPIRLELKNGGCVELRGLIDRVDLYEADEKLYVRIVDYKTGRHEFSLQDVKTGMDIQLVLYLFAVVSSNPEKLASAGAQYLYAHAEGGKTKISRSGFLLDNEKIHAAADSTPNRIYSQGLYRQSAKEISQLISDMQTVVCDVGEQILSGKANRTPSEKACKFCPVKGSCDVACRSKN